MSFQPGAAVYTQGFGTAPENIQVPHIDVRAPTSTDLGPFFPLGKTWLDKVAGNYYVLANLSTSNGVTTANWAFLGSSSGDLNSLTTDDLTVVTPTSGTIIFTGNATQGVSTTGSNAPGTASVTVADWTTSQKGVGVLASDAQGIAGSGTTQAVTPHAMNAKLGTQTIHGVVLGGGSTAALGVTAAGTSGQVLLGSTGADPAFGTLTTSTGIAYTTGAHALAINLQQGGYAINAASTGVSLVAQNAYTITQAAQTSFALPATASVGDQFLIASALGNTSGWIITQGAGQEIWAAANHTTSGATGTLAGALHCSVVLMCTVANVEFIIVGGSGLTGLTFT